ncbi:MAG: hypothetical protein HY260_01675 [Chloroflexi bacterium]|nr:hypothetical protein [Chloroflexota bacterium]
MPARPRLIRASEIGEYVYCHRAWWLGRVQGEASINVAEMAAGAGGHARHGQTVAAAGCLQLAAYIFIALAVVVAVVWLASAMQ